MSFDTSALKAALVDHGPVTRVVIARLTGSSPREVGTAMLVWSAGQSGTIGGGALEYEAAKRARIGVTGAVDYPLGPTLGQCCGGHVTLVFERFETIADVPGQGPTYGRKVQGFGVLTEPMIDTKQPLWLWGAGHVGRAVAEVMHDMPDFDLTWADTGMERFPTTNIRTIPAPSLPDLMSKAPKDAMHLIFTYAHEMDLDLCHRALQHGFRFCGLIGSQTKWARFRSKLRTLGHSDAAISRITCPIGDPSLGKHPKMIALGVAHRLGSTQHDTGGYVA
ncbi:MAG: xanthine dehydrogenase accessory protein XdhC [Planktomarina sp.]